MPKEPSEDVDQPDQDNLKLQNAITEGKVVKIPEQHYRVQLEGYHNDNGIREALEQLGIGCLKPGRGPDDVFVDQVYHEGTGGRWYTITLLRHAALLPEGIEHIGRHIGAKLHVLNESRY